MTLIPPPGSGPTLPQGQLLGNYPTMQAAEEAVEKLVDQGIGLHYLAIVGRDVRVVNYLRSRRGYPATVLRSAVQGAFFGLFVGLLLMSLDANSEPLQLVSSMAVGIGVWVLIGVIGHWMRRKSTKFDSATQVVAVSYDLLCDTEVAGKARQILGPQTLRGAGSTPGIGYPSYGERASGGTTTAHGTTNSATNADTSGQKTADAPETNTTVSGTSNRPSGFADLPDGRPQFGARIDQSLRPGKPEEDESPDKDADSQSKDTTGTER